MAVNVGPKQIPTIITPQLAVTAGTPARLSSSDLWVYSVVISAKHTNSGRIYIGDTSSNALNSNGYGISLAASGVFTIDFQHHRGIACRFNLKDIWYDGDTSGDKIIVWYTK